MDRADKKHSKDKPATTRPGEGKYRVRREAEKVFPEPVERTPGISMLVRRIKQEEEAGRILDQERPHRGLVRPVRYAGKSYSLYSSKRWIPDTGNRTPAREAGHGSETPRHDSIPESGPEPVRDLSRLTGREIALEVARGLDRSFVGVLVRLGYRSDEIVSILGPGLASQSRHPLSSAESDAAVRMHRVATQAIRAFVDPERAWRWLRKPKAAFDGMNCIDMLATEVGGREIEEMIIRIEHGMAA